MTNPADAPTISEVELLPDGMAFPATYAVSADVSSVANACAGITVLEHSYNGYGLLVCPNGYTEAVGLVVEPFTNTLVATANFSTFGYEQT